MSSPNDVIAGGAFRSDLQNTSRVLQAEWVVLFNEAVNSTWDQCAAARPDFQVASYDVALQSGASASFQVPAAFHSVIDVVFGPDTTQEYSLGPFNWLNRRSPGGWVWAALVGYGSACGGTNMRLMGWDIFVEPSRQAAGAYRLWYCPKPHVAVQIVRLATAGALPACVTAGSGVGKTLTASANGALTVDGCAVLVGDKILIKNQASSGDNGVYVVISAGSMSSAWQLMRQPGYDTTATVTTGEALNDICAVGQSDAALPVGATNEAKFFTVTTFTAMESPQTWTEGAALDPILERFVEVLQLKVAIPALHRDNRGATAVPFERRLSVVEAEMKNYLGITRSPGPQRMADRAGNAPWGGNGWGSF
jgi:hypothetical protein